MTTPLIQLLRVSKRYGEGATELLALKRIDLDIEAVGDLHIDGHHTVEDVGISLGMAVARVQLNWGR